MGQRINGKIEYDYGREYSGQILDGKPDGIGVYSSMDGCYSGEFLQGKYHGKGEFVFPLYNRTLFDNRKYDLREKYIGRWVENKKEGPFVHMMGGIPYDEMFQNGEKVLSPICYVLPEGEPVKDDSEIKCWYGGQSSFIIETYEETLVFDWYRANMPPLNTHKPVYLFISHVHMDHFNRRIFTLSERYNVKEIYIGYDRENEETEGVLDDLSESVWDILSCFKGKQFLLTDFGSVGSICSTDLGVAFLVKTKFGTFFHAGDLFCQSLLTFNDYKKQRGVDDLDGYDESKEKKLHTAFGITVDSNESEFREFVDSLQEVNPIDYAMIPMDPRWDDFGIRTVNYYLKSLDVRLFTPMHLWEQWDFVSDYLKVNPESSQKMISVNPDKYQIRQSIELNMPYMLRLKN